MKLTFIDSGAISKMVKMMPDAFSKTNLFAEVARVNTLSMIMEAGSGHIGSSFSAMDIVSWLWCNELQNPNSRNDKKSDTYFSSKGHDVPGLYAILIGLGILPFEFVHKLRRLGGLPGHPDVGTPTIATNTGSLGMGVSKAHGMALARRLQKKEGRFYVLTGDGELQEGQLWESLQPVANAKLSEITVIIDNNKIQSDKLVSKTSDLSDLGKKLEIFGWAVRRIDGHNLKEISEAIAWAKTIKDRPQAIIADTVKGKGVSFMEKMNEEGFYKFHSGAPTYELYTEAINELTNRINEILNNVGIETLKIVETNVPDRVSPKNVNRLINAYGDELLKLGEEHEEIVALDADLLVDTGVLPFASEFPERYIEAGIAEQDMVSIAGGIARQGMLPILHSFACFMPTRANDQIYNNASEKTKIIYTASLAGLLPAGPGHSHQSVRDISLVGSIPGMTLIEPSSEKETRLALRWAVEENKESTYIRLVSIPIELPFPLPDDYSLFRGKGIELKNGKDIVIFAYGPVMLSEAFRAAELLEKENMSVKVINLPWLNTIDETWFAETINGSKLVVSIDDHYAKFGQGMMIGETLAQIPNAPDFLQLGLKEIPECGTAAEALSYHRLDSSSIAQQIKDSATRSALVDMI